MNIQVVGKLAEKERALELRLLHYETVSRATAMC